MEMDSNTSEPNEPPDGYEPQVPLSPGQAPGIVERTPDLIHDAEAEQPERQLTDLGDADDDDDEEGRA